MKSYLSDIPVDLQVSLVEVGALIEQYSSGRDNIFFHSVFALFMLLKVVWWFRKRWREDKASEQARENAELDRLRKIEDLKWLQKQNQENTDEEVLKKMKRMREQLQKNIDDNY